METNPRVRVVHCQSAEELLDALSPRGPYLGEPYRGCWVFRGQANAQWPLIPSAFRPEKRLKASAYWLRVEELKTNSEQIQAEIVTLRTFVEAADAAGLALPEDSHTLRTDLADLLLDISGKKISRVEWPTQRYWSLIALAQHCGIPTRFIDWSRNAYKAAYFPALERAKEYVELDQAGKGRPQGNIAIWAYCHVFHRQIANRIAENGGEPPLTHLVMPPAASNRNLHAQEGMLMVYMPSIHELDAPAHRPTFDDELERISEHWGDEPPLIYKFTMPAEAGSLLLGALYYEGVNAATLFPGYEGAALSVFEDLYRLDP
jgi:hypothetical protein